MFLTIFYAANPPYTVDLESFGKSQISFGRAPDNDIVLASSIVSSHHGVFVFARGRWVIVDLQSLNGIYVNDERVPQWKLSEGLKVCIGSQEHAERVMFSCQAQSAGGSYRLFHLTGQTVRIGRNKDCDICLPGMGIAGVHAELVSEGGKYILRPVKRNIVRCNGATLPKQGVALRPMDRFRIGNVNFICRKSDLMYQVESGGFSVDVSHLTKRVGRGGSKKVIVDDVDFHVRPGELVAIIGGSGAGKSSLLKCVCGCSKFDEGSVLIQGEDIGTGYESMRGSIGYVPQQDIVYDDLTLERMLHYSAKLRMPKDVSEEEIRKRTDEVLRTLELDGNEQTMIRSLSGGQKKRASIAVELLSDPGVFFLDEPTSGLDPGTEQSLMHTLKNMAEGGKTVILVTHTPLNLDLCDRIIVMGAGGRLCYFGNPQEAPKFFGAENLVDIYNRVAAAPSAWKERYAGIQESDAYRPSKKQGIPARVRVSALRQTRILAARYLEIMKNDWKKVCLQLLMAPGMGLFLYFAFRESLYPFVYSVDTQTFALTLSCCGFWIGLFQAIQEICKERSVMERERMAGLKCGSYLASKVLVLCGVLLLQCLLLLGVVWLLVGHPTNGMVFANMPFLEYYLTTFLNAFSAAMMGLLVSALVERTDQAVMAAPLLLIPQILFSQVLCSLSGIGEAISMLVSCQWSSLAYGASANINELLEKTEETLDSYWGNVEAETKFLDARYSFASDTSVTWSDPTPMAWIAMLLLAIAFMVITWLLLRRKKEM